MTFLKRFLRVEINGGEIIIKIVLFIYNTDIAEPRNNLSNSAFDPSLNMFKINVTYIFFVNLYFYNLICFF